MAIAILVAVVPGIRNWQDYVRWATDPRQAEPVVQIGRYLAQQPEAQEALIVSRTIRWDQPELRFLLHDRKGRNAAPEDLTANRLASIENGTIIVLHGAEAFALEDQIRQAYPQGTLEDGSIPPTRDVFHVFVTAPSPR
jgi:hypothetical protein